MSQYPEFFNDAACAFVPNVVFVGPRDEEREDAAKRRRLALTICNGGALPDGTVLPECPVRRECLAYNLENSLTVGVAGGETARGRRPMGRGTPAAPAPKPEAAPEAAPAPADARPAVRVFQDLLGPGAPELRVYTSADIEEFTSTLAPPAPPVQGE